MYGPPDYVRLSIYLDDGNHTSTCRQSVRTNSPTPAPTRPPTSPPTPSPTPPPTPSPTAAPVSISKAPPRICDDSRNTFRLHPDNPTRITCPVLETNAALRKNLCVPSHEAYSLCEETCEVCSDNCTDSTKTFYVNNNWKDQNCHWLKDQPTWREFMCHPNHEVYRICGETCGSCDDPDGPPLPPITDDCDDSPTGTFFVNEIHGHKNCMWLSKNPILHSRLCVPERAAYHVCEETCRKCRDRCNDNPDAKFWVNQDHGFKDCLWLSKRPGWINNICNNEKHDARTLCKETCNIC